MVQFSGGDWTPFMCDLKGLSRIDFTQPGTSLENRSNASINESASDLENIKIQTISGSL